MRNHCGGGGEYKTLPEYSGKPGNIQTQEMKTGMPEVDYQPGATLEEDS